VRSDFEGERGSLGGVLPSSRYFLAHSLRLHVVLTVFLVLQVLKMH
jgi:hypothetical protein